MFFASIWYSSILYMAVWNHMAGRLRLENISAIANLQSHSNEQESGRLLTTIAHRFGDALDFNIQNMDTKCHKLSTDKIYF